MQPVLAAYNFCNPDFAAFLDDTAAAGYKYVAIGFYGDYLPLRLPSVSAAEEAWLRDELDRYDLTMVAVFAGGVNLLADEGLADLLASIETTARFEVSVLDLGSFSYDSKTSDQIKAEEKLFVERIRIAGDRAGESGITLCLETHGGFTGDTDTCLQAMAVIDHPQVKLAYDPANFLYYEGKLPEDRIEQLCPHVGHTHLKDHRGAKGNPDFPLIGQGQTNYDLILPALWQGGYRGPYTLERAPGDTPQARRSALAEAYQYLTRMLPGD
jgi:sugar phosphate isomerase/epimerase